MQVSSINRIPPIFLACLLGVGLALGSASGVMAQDQAGTSSAKSGNSSGSGSKSSSSSGSSSDKNKDKDKDKDAPKVRPNVPPAATKKNTLGLSPLLATDWKPGCGCSFYKPTDQKENGPLLLRLGDNKAATVRAEGQLEELKLLDEKHILKKPPAILAKDRMLLKFKGTNTAASFSGSVERNCPKFKDSCKAVTY